MKPGAMHLIRAQYIYFAKSSHLAGRVNTRAPPALQLFNKEHQALRLRHEKSDMEKLDGHNR